MPPSCAQMCCHVPPSLLKLCCMCPCQQNDAYAMPLSKGHAYAQCFYYSPCHATAMPATPKMPLSPPPAITTRENGPPQCCYLSSHNHHCPCFCPPATQVLQPPSPPARPPRARCPEERAREPGRARGMATTPAAKPAASRAQARAACARMLFLSPLLLQPCQQEKRRRRELSPACLRGEREKRGEESVYAPLSPTCFQRRDGRR